MMKKVIYGTFVVAVVLVLTGCSQVMFPEGNRSHTLRNGVVLTEAEAARLDALTPQARSIVTQARSAVGDDTSLAAEVNKGFKELLKKEFGDDWKKYVVVSVESQTANIETQEIVAQEAEVFVDPETMEPLEQGVRNDIARATDGVREESMGFGYVMQGRREYWDWWWGFSNNANTLAFLQLNGTRLPIEVTKVYAKVKDKAGTVEQSRALSHSVEAEGNFYYAVGYSKSTCYTSHRAVMSTVDALGNAVTLDTGVFTYTWRP